MQGNGFALAVGVLGTLYGAQGIGRAALNAMNTIWNVPYKNWPNFFKRWLRGYLWLAALFIATIVSTFAAGFGTALLHGAVGWLWSLLVAFIINLGVFYVVFTVLTAEPLRWRDVWVGVTLATVFWQALQAAGGLYVRHSLSRASHVYGFFAIVTFLFLAAQLTLLAAEVNVVLHYRLWPRSLTQPPLIRADRETFERLARMEERRPEVQVSISFTPEADRQPLSDKPDGTSEPDGTSPPDGASPSGDTPKNCSDRPKVERPDGRTTWM